MSLLKVLKTAMKNKEKTMKIIKKNIEVREQGGDNNAYINR